MVNMRERGSRDSSTSMGLGEKVVYTRRVAKVIKGGRHLRFNALVVVGDGQGYVGVGMGKAKAIPDAVRKGNAVARKSLIKVPMKGSTVPHESLAKFSAAIVLIKPAPPGTGIIAGGGVRAVMELAGIKDVVTKSLGCANPINVVKATIVALSQLRDPATELARRHPPRESQGQPPTGRVG